MAGITISKKDLESLLKKTLSVAELGTLLHSVKGELKETNGDELKIDLDDTNRPDLLCAEGIAREIKYQISNIKYCLTFHISPFTWFYSYGTSGGDGDNRNFVCDAVTGGAESQVQSDEG